MRPYIPYNPIILLLVVALSFNSAILAQSQCARSFRNKYTGAGPLEPLRTLATSDKGNLVAGRVLTSSNASYDAWVAKFSEAGAVEWSYSLGGADADEFSGAQELHDGSYILYGTTHSYGYTSGKAWLVHMSSAGNLLWSRQMGTKGNGTDRPKALTQLPDGDLIGSFNINDSSDKSNPVVFRMGIDGTIKWQQEFDNGNEESFTGIQFTNDTIYVYGFYTATMKSALIVSLRPSDGSIIESRNPYVGRKWYSEDYDEEIAGLDMHEQKISFGLTLSNRKFGTYATRIIIVAVTDMQGTSELARHFYGYDYMKLLRTKDQGFLVFSVSYYDPLVKTDPRVAYINKYGVIENSLTLAAYENKSLKSVDLTADGGFVAALYQPWPWYRNDILELTKGDMYCTTGQASCQLFAGSMHDDTTSFTWKIFQWQHITPYTSPLNEIVLPAKQNFSLIASDICDTLACTDTSPLPPGCNKSSRIEYVTRRNMVLRDVTTTADGGKILTGNSGNFNAVAIKLDINGDILWSKNYNRIASQMRFMRTFKMADGNLLAFANLDYTINHGSSSKTVMVKLDNLGIPLWSRIINSHLEGLNVNDVISTPDNGFLVLFKNYWGGGKSIILKLDKEANFVWQKCMVHKLTNPLYKSAFCTNNDIFLAHESYYYNQQVIGLERLDLKTGNLIWSRNYGEAAQTTLRINRIFGTQDSIYLFCYRYQAATPGRTETRITMASFDMHGDIGHTIQFDTENNSYPGSAYYTDDTPPSVVQTADSKFVLCQRNIKANDTSFVITRLDTTGKIEWSRKYPSIKNYRPHNIHQQGTGYVITGTVHTPTKYVYEFYNGFVIKCDSAGHITSSPTGECSDITINTAVVPFSMTYLPESLNNILDTAYRYIDAQVLYNNEPADARLFCNETKSCGTVNMLQKGKVCSLTDTLICYLKDAVNCDAIATWEYNSDILHPISINGDTIRLKPLKTGVSNIAVTIEGNCLVDHQSLDASILISAGDVTLGDDKIICPGKEVSVNAGTGYNSYQWNGTTGDSILKVTAPGTYYIDVTDNCGRAGSDTIKVIAASSFFSTTQDTTKCNLDSVLLQSTAGYNNYTWFTKTTTLGNNSKIYVKPDVSTRYYINAVTQDNCTLTDSVLVNVLHSPPINLGGDVSICEGDSIIVSAGTGFDTFLWNNGKRTPVITVKTTGIYSVDATYNNGCHSKDSFALKELYVNPSPKINAPVLCAGTTRMLSVAPGYPFYQWSNGATGNTTPFSATGTYWVKVTDNKGCKGSDTVNITSTVPVPKAFLPADTSICQYGKLQLTAKGSFRSYLWNNNSNAASITVDKPGTYWLQVTDNNNCEGKAFITIASRQCMTGLYVPTAFTPNGDGKNDIIRPLLFGNIEQFYFSIYSRWGTCIFETTAPGEGWNGKIKGVPQDGGTYVWMCRYTLEGQPPQTHKGTFILMR
ncbi:T9SS type B sorting domain-containing protein [Filimonas effusa]|uniref:T9SS type B sorting domain-containing protein n=1 Tax=Filimonas effusa TaxID=2508721 RepID=A0A4Q1DB91_9BACT|nr:T9SS type B sorting domain-containing protein [Filimonas effusa]RXK85769.1 T9SS type B sorting domain-containing protein [Filimonas effusa]